VRSKAERNQRFATQARGTPATFCHGSSDARPCSESIGTRLAATLLLSSPPRDAYVKPWCTALELNVICTELEVCEGRLTGRYKGGDCVGPEKRRRIEANYRLTDFTNVYAYGDTIEDQQMLSLADHKYFRWREVGGPIQQRRKSDHVDEVVGR